MILGLLACHWQVPSPSFVQARFRTGGSQDRPSKIDVAPGRLTCAHFFASGFRPDSCFVSFFASPSSFDDDGSMLFTPREREGYRVGCPPPVPTALFWESGPVGGLFSVLLFLSVPTAMLSVSVRHCHWECGQQCRAHSFNCYFSAS